MTKRASTARSVRQALQVAQGPFTLLGYDPAGTPLAPGSKSKARKDLDRTGTVLAAQQEMLYANGASGDQRRVLLVLQGTDTSGKDGVVSHVVGQVGPAGVRITSFRRPTAEERAHHFLWRIRRALPAAGIIGVFNRSHYEDVLVTRVHESIDEAAWAERIADINAFERELADSGTVLVKCFLHISYDEQRERLLARLDDPAKLLEVQPRRPGRAGLLGGLPVRLCRGDRRHLHRARAVAHRAQRRQVVPQLGDQPAAVRRPARHEAGLSAGRLRHRGGPGPAAAAVLTGPGGSEPVARRWAPASVGGPAGSEVRPCRAGTPLAGDVAAGRDG